jgi:signal transduction histidine kinase
LVAAELPEVHGNVPALETLLVNLLMNALQAVESGDRVLVEATVKDQLVELVVSDNGPGVSADIRTKVFDPFFTTKDAGKGTGLGLTVCRTIVDRHNGTIRLEENEGGGARFVVSLPSMEGRF